MKFLSSCFFLYFYTTLSAKNAIMLPIFMLEIFSSSGVNSETNKCYNY